jgi:serine/threonine protein kinase
MSSPSGNIGQGSGPEASDERFDPYYKWLGIPPDEQPPNYYRLLGVKLFETDLDVIESAADRQMAHLRRFAGGRRAELSQRLLNEVSTAKNCLLDEQAKLAYDAEQRKTAPSPEEAAVPKGKRRTAWPDGTPPKNLDEFLKCLAASHLYTRAEMDAYIESLPPDRRPTDAASMAKEMVQSKKLTKYQAACIYQGRPFHLLFGKYEVIDRIGVGGMGQVYRARHRQMDRLAAVKVLSSKSLQSDRAVERFRREVKMAAQLAHKNIVATYDADDVDGEQYLVMEYVEGRDMAAILKQQGPLSPDDAVDGMIQAARGLEYIHSKGIVHRDIKPGNLMQTHDGTVQISDLGLARLNEDPMGTTGDENAAKLTMPGQIIGTVDYMSPEQAVDTHAADARSDVYSLGCTFYRLLTGELPYPAQTKMQKLLAHRSTPIPSVRAKRPEVSAAIDDVIQKMMAKEPADRYQSATEVIDALENARRGGPPQPVKRPEPRPGAAAAPRVPEPAPAGDAGPLPMSGPAPGVTPGAPVPGQPGTPGMPHAAAPTPGQPVSPGQPAAPLSTPDTQAQAADFAAPHPEFANNPPLQEPATGEDTITRQLGDLAQSSVHDRVASRTRRSQAGSSLSPIVLLVIGGAAGVILLLLVLVVFLIIKLQSQGNNGPSEPPPPDTTWIEDEETHPTGPGPDAAPGVGRWSRTEFTGANIPDAQTATPHHETPSGRRNRDAWELRSVSRMAGNSP